MKPSKFSYYAPERVEEAVGLLAEHGGDAKVLAGGQSLVPMMSFRLATVEHLIDINTVAGLDTIERLNGLLRIGALVRQAVAEHDTTVAGSAPLVARALPHIGHFQIRNRGTIGGSIAHADPASELPAVALALDATMEIDGPGGHREVAASDFFESTWTTALGDDELLTAIRFPVWSGRVGFAVEEIARRHGDQPDGRGWPDRGGVVQGIGNVLFEHMAYDDAGNPLATSFMDYLLPSAPEIPTSSSATSKRCRPRWVVVRGWVKVARSAHHQRSQTP